MKNTVAKLRKENGWSQEYLAQQLGVSRQTIISIEKGHFDPSLPLAFDIARVFNQRIEDVFFPEK
ncbi:helix-turn-helix transcriptional regulator [Arcanobacterium pinnipediorum]|uniref:Helix-turn-helix transcriptional regulator n=1 Tax=Arcanobacterium pinnipediorum TaxID=1503041 RepID=A0ABY5AFA5_9ACTO|nr:helix-turn-helix transcriptional regulator [Arcanobacterium pinnipediorum]USR78894.1 helix-turn-helix transcriptional regulator [Arcanobacterium pinnipediorum]